MTPLISIQILNWNRAQDTLLAIQSALNQTYPNIEVIVIDNGSSDNSIVEIRKNYPDIKVIELDKNYGCPGGRNRGIEFCNGAYIFYLDNDGVLHQNALKNAYRSITSKPNIGVVTGKVYDFDNHSEIDAKCAIRKNIQYDFNDFQGGICMHDKKIYDQVGYYPPHFMYGAEETYLSLKLSETKYTIIKDESVVLWHKKSDTARDRTGEILNGYYNNLYMAMVLYPLNYAFQFLIYFVFKYPIHAKNQNIFRPFLESIPKRFISNITKGIRERKAISTKAYLRFRKFKPIIEIEK